MSKKRTLHLEIESCRFCPYCEYDSRYSMSDDSGWDCMNGDTDKMRIIDDGDLVSGKKFPRFPEWCPLSEK